MIFWEAGKERISPLKPCLQEYNFKIITHRKVFNFRVFRILRSRKNETKKCSFLSFFRILRNREKRLCTVDYRIPKCYSQKQEKWILSHFGNSFQEQKSEVSKLNPHFGNKKISQRSRNLTKILVKLWENLKSVQKFLNEILF